MKKTVKKIIVSVLVVVMICNSFEFVEKYFDQVSFGTVYATFSQKAGTLNGKREEVSKQAEIVQEPQMDTTKHLKEQENAKMDTAGSQTVSSETPSVVIEEVSATPEVTEELLQDVLEEELLADPTSELPDSAADLQQNQIYNLYTNADVLKLQELSMTSSLKGYTFQFAQYEKKSNVWDFTKISGFTGFGCEEYPFQGTIQEYYETGVVFNLNKPMFDYLGSGAKLTNLNITATNTTAGIANYLILSDTEQITYRNVKISGNVYNKNASVNEGAAGALYGTVTTAVGTTGQCELSIDGNGINVTGITKVQGLIAGGYIGQVKGNIKLLVSDGSNVAASVTTVSVADSMAGGMIGKVAEGSTFEVTSGLTVNNTVGYDADSNSVNGARISIGGIIGVCDNATVLSTKEVIRDKSVKTKFMYAGGYIGHAVDSTITISDFQLNKVVFAGVGTRNNQEMYAGGVIGKYESARENTSLTISNIGIADKILISAGENGNADKENRAGGIAGAIIGDNVTITDINAANSTRQFLVRLDRHAYDNNDTSLYVQRGKLGGIAGEISGKNILVSDVSLNFDSSHAIAGSRTGGVFGKVGQASKIKLNNITIENFTIYVYQSAIPVCAGGLLGDVDKGTLIALDGTIDVSGITPYFNGSTSDASAVLSTLRGYIAGKQTESLIYLEQGASIQHNEIVSELDDNLSTWEKDYYGKNYGTTLDDIGTYGGIYKNVTDDTNPDPEGNPTPVIDFTKDYGKEITGEVAYSNGAYQLENDADALRLAIALNTFDGEAAQWNLRFATGCFQTGATGRSLLSADYQVKADLDFNNTGIYSLCRNDSTDYEFSGSMRGAVIGHTLLGEDKYPTISLHIISKQTYAGLFVKVNGGDTGAVFENLNLSGCMYYVWNGGGLANFAAGKLTLNNVNTTMKMRTSSTSYTVASAEPAKYGGLIGQYESGESELFIYDCEIAPEITNMRIHQIVGGMIGYVKTGSTDITAENIHISNVAVKSRITAGANYEVGCSNAYYEQARVGGMIAYIGYDTINSFSSASASLGGTYKDATYAVMGLKDITVDSTVIDMSTISTNKEYIRATGGLLGYNWNNIEVTVQGIEVKDSEINSLGRVGGLLTSLAGKMEFQGDVKLKGLTMKNLSSAKWTYSSFLIGDGRFAVITLDTSKYIIDKDKVSCQNYSSFDEIVGVNYELASDAINTNAKALGGTDNSLFYATRGDFKNGGILNLIIPEFSQMGTAEYGSYENQVLTNTNKYTRYYYNLFLKKADTENNSDYAVKYDYQPVVVNGAVEIDSPEDLMLWSLYRYSNDKIKRFLAPYFVDGSGALKTVSSNVSIQGTLDMKGYSYYPCQASNHTINGDNGVIVLYAEEIDNAEKSQTDTWNQRTTYDNTKQHYMMHAGLLVSSSGVKINSAAGSSLSFQGTAANLGIFSGALIVNYLSGTSEISNIKLDGLRLANYNAEAGAGILISNITDNSKVTIKGIETTTAYDTLYSGDKKLAAAALIGQVGSSTATDFSIKFSQMKVDDNKYDAKNEPTNHVFRYASFIYNYDSVDNSATNKSFGVYTFTKSETDSTAPDYCVSYGDEIKDGVGYFDGEADTELSARVLEAQNGNYIPYTYTGKNIFVNPRNGNLTEGCGTYEDPYIISSSKQLLTLYCYLTGSSSYDGIFSVSSDPNYTGWAVNKVGNGTVDGRCDVSSGGAVTSHTAVSFVDGNGNKDSEFPSKDELRTAYYKITNDIDLSTYQDANEKVMAENFSGLGCADYPFAGVFVGDKDNNGSRPVITLPKNRENTSTVRYWINYGLFQYMKGAVVKNIHIQTAEVSGQRENIPVSNVGGCVAANVLGGDNIIDGVSVDMGFDVSTTGSGTNISSSAMTGSYVGYIKHGSVIIRNMGQSDIEKYSVGYLVNKVRTEITADTRDKFLRNSRVIGWVDDGCVIYEGTNISNSSYTCESSEFGFTDNFPLSYSFPIINGNRLKQACSVNKIQVSGNADSGFTLKMHNTEQLEIAALALNSDAFSAYNSGNRDSNHYNGYDYTALCRKAQYDYVGCKNKLDAGTITAAEMEDYQSAINYDDKYTSGYYPYLYQYMDFSALASTTSGNVYADTMAQVAVTQKIEDNKIYGLLNGEASAVLDDESHASIIGSKCVLYKGDGVTTYELYNEAESTGSATPTNYNLAAYGRAFRGFGALYEPSGYRYSVFKANFDGHGATVTMDMNRDWDASVLTTGMFNNLQTYRKANPSDSSDLGGFSIKNFTILNSNFKGHTTAGNTTTGAVAGQVKGIWHFENITLKRTTESKDSEGNTIPDVYGKHYTGGFIGCINYYREARTKDAYEPLALSNQKITFSNCGVEGSAAAKCVMESDNSCGGLVGFVEGRCDSSWSYWNYWTYFGTIEVTNCFSKYCDIMLKTNQGSAGGFIGRVGYSWSELSDSTRGCSRGNVTITQTIAGNTLEHVTIWNETPNNSGNNYAQALGGVIGIFSGLYSNRSYPDYLTRLTITGVKADNLNVTNNGEGTDKKSGTGGMVGYVWAEYVNISKVSVSNSKIESLTTGSGYTQPAGGLVGRLFTDEAEIYDCQVSDSTVHATNNGAGGFIGNNEVANVIGLTIGSLEGGQGNQIKNSTIWSEKYYAGGVVAQQANTSCKIWAFSNISVTGSTIYAGVADKDDANFTLNNNAAYRAGGIAGYINNNVLNVTMKDIYVGQGTSIAGFYAGGLTGALDSAPKITLDGDICIGCKKTVQHQTDSSGNPVDVTTITQDAQSNVIYGGKYAGGLHGMEKVTTSIDCKADVRIYNTKIGAYCKSIAGSSAMVGGVAGHKEGNAVTKYDNFEMKNCVLVGRGQNNDQGWVILGGLYGYIANNNQTYFYHPKLSNNNMGDYRALTSFQALKDLSRDSQDVKLLYGDSAKAGESVHYADSTVKITEKNVGKYAYSIGNYFGRYAGTSGNIYVLRPELHYEDDFLGNRPVVDCGSATATQNDTTYGTKYYGLDSPYEWRKYVHMIYFEPGTDTVENVITDSDLITVGKGENEYLYGSIEHIFQTYKNSLNDTSDTKDFLDAYRLNVKMEGDGLLEYYDSCVNRNSQKYNGFPVMVIDGKNEQEVLDSTMGILTNVGGIGSSSSAPLGTAVLNIKCQSAKITSDGKIVKNSAKQASLSVSNNKISHTAYYDEPVAELDANGNEIPDKYGYTITLVTYNFGWTGADGTEKTETIYIPVYMVERVSLYSDLRIMEGEQYSMTAAKSDTSAYKGDVYVSNDSSFTLFAEFAYNSTRKKDRYKDKKVKKALNLRQINASNQKVEVAYPAGMKFTLVDAATGKAYYYQVPENNTSSSISFDTFMNEGDVVSIGNLKKEQTTYKYNGQNITDIVENGFGLEQYFIYVDNSQANIPKTAIYYLELSTDNNPENELSYFDRNEAEDIKFIWQPSMSIGFYNVNSDNYKDKNGNQEYGFDADRTTKTQVTGAITNSSVITIDTSIQVKAEQVYWDAKNDVSAVFIDSKNSGKYVDIAIFLIDPTTLETVPLPAGTNIVVGDKREPSVDKSVIYSYKDSNIQIPLDDIKSNLGGYNYEMAQENRTSFKNSKGQDIFSYRTITLDFANADLDNYVDVENYTIRLELWRTADAEYPLGGDRLETYDFGVPCYGKKEEAVSINVKEENFMALGINTYQQTASSYEIPFVTKLDFSGMIKNGKESDIENCANKDYLITYQLKKKVKQSEGSYSYETVAASHSDDKSVGDNLKLCLSIEDGGVGTAIEPLKRLSVNGECVYTTVRKFSVDEIKNAGVDDNAKYAVSWGTLLQVDTTDIAAKDYSNYQVEVRIVPFDGTGANYETNKANAIDSIFTTPDNLVDQCIYNIAKIKTTS